MNDKEFNLAILNKLYEIAKEVFAHHVNVKEGSYTANDLAKMGTSIFEDGYLQTEEKRVKENVGTRFEQTINKACYVAPLAAVEHLTFSCSFCIATLFSLVAKFEKLAAVGSKRYIFVRAKELANVVSKVTIEITKDLGTLCACAANDDMRPLMNCVCLDIPEHKAVASDGHVMQVKYFAVVDKSEYKETYQQKPLIPAKEFKKMCSLAGKSGANLVCTLVKEQEGAYEKEYWICECKGITTKFEAVRYVNYHGVMPKINTHNIVSLSVDTWKGLKKWLKANKDFNDCSHLVKIKHEEGSDEITFNMENIDFGKEVNYSVCCTGVPTEKFAIGVSAISLLKLITGDVCLALPEDSSRAVSVLGTKEYGICMPMLINDEYDQYRLPAGTTDPMCACDFPTKEECEVLDSANECPNERTESLETAKVVGNTTERVSEPQNAKEVTKSEPSKEMVTEYHRVSIFTGGIVISSNYRKRENNPEPPKEVISEPIVNDITATEQNKVTEKSVNVAKSENANVVTKSVTTKKAAGTTNKEQRKFTFEKVGVKPGDVLTFVDGTEVTATADNKVEFCGEVFTLSGFTKQFTPNPTKSGAYRGCDWFYKDGVKLSKLFKQYLDGLDNEHEEAVTTEQEVTEHDVTLDSERKELPPPPPVIYIDVDNLPNDTKQSDWEAQIDEIHESPSLRMMLKAQVRFYIENDIYVLEDNPSKLRAISYNAKDDRFVILNKDTDKTFTLARQEFSRFYNENIITEYQYEILKGKCEPPKVDYPDYMNEDATAEPQKAACVPLEVKSEVITPPSKENVSGAKETTSLQLDVGTLAKVVQIALGVPIEYGTPPPRYGGGAKVANQSLAYVVGDYSLTAGKVVHELPLPPPKQNKTWIQKKHYYSQRHSNTLKVLVHSPPLTHCSVPYI